MYGTSRSRWLKWLFEAKKRFKISILNYTVTSNHVHLVIRDDKERDAIPQAIQLIAGRTGHEYNQRKNRKGAFWEDRYHATAIEANSHLIECMVSVDLNMVRAGVVAHPSAWAFCGYHEIMHPRQRYSLIDNQGLMGLFDVKSQDELRNTYRGWGEEALERLGRDRQPRWTESIAVGSEAFVRDTKGRLGIRALGRGVIETNGSYELREPKIPYEAVFDPKNVGLREENTFYWDVSASRSTP